MSTPFDLYQTVWWRFSRYEIKDGYIRPALDAELVSYDPWVDYRDSWVFDPDSATPLQEKRKNKPPYISLLNLLDEIRFSPLGGLTPESANQILEWCSEYGLLGMLSQRVQMASLAPRWMSTTWKGLSDFPRPFEDGKFHEVSYQYFRANSYTDYRGWYPLMNWAQDGESGKQEDELVPLESKSEFRPRALVQDIRLRVSESDGSWDVIISGSYYEEPLKQTWGKFFPDVPEKEKETYFYPIPNSDNFWSIYAESIEDFLTGALLLQDALEEIEVEGSLESAQPFHYKLNFLLSPVSTIIKRSEYGSLQQRWTAPSLISCFATMASQDLTQDRKVLACETCNKMFVTEAYQARYCSDKCRRTAQKRRYREKLKETSNDDKKKNR
jgi:hypothetical protein